MGPIYQLNKSYHSPHLKFVSVLFKQNLNYATNVTLIFRMKSDHLCDLIIKYVDPIVIGKKS